MPLCVPHTHYTHSQSHLSLGLDSTTREKKTKQFFLYGVALFFLTHSHFLLIYKILTFIVGNWISFNFKSFRPTKNRRECSTKTIDQQDTTISNEGKTLY